MQIFYSCLEVWKEVPTHGSPPPGLAAGASAHSGHYFYIYGGVKEDYSLSGCLHRLDSITFSWTQLAAHSANAPMKKFGCGMIVYENSVVVIGGHGIKAGPIQPGSEWIRGGNAQGITNEMHKYELSEGKKVSGKKVAKTPIEKLDVAGTIFQPAAIFHFPAHSMYGQTRHFRYQWLNNNKW